MLKLYLATDYSSESGSFVNKQHKKHFITDIDEAFKGMQLEQSYLEKMAVKSIDKGELISSTEFITEFGLRLHIDCLSTSCKAALFALHNHNDGIILDLRACDQRARDFIVAFCRSGAIAIYHPEHRYEEFCIFNTKEELLDENGKFHHGGDTQIEVAHRNFIFTNLFQLNIYFEYYPYYKGEGEDYAGDKYITNPVLNVF